MSGDSCCGYLLGICQDGRLRRQAGASVGPVYELEHVLSDG